MEYSWQDLQDELALWQQANQPLSFWWRDDDAETDSPALSALLSLSEEFNIPLALATIPLGADESLSTAITTVNHRQGTKLITILQHGYSHRNHAPHPQKKQELGMHRDINTIIDELVIGKTKLSHLFSDCFVSVQVPPWNRIDDEIIERIASSNLFDVISRHGMVNNKKMPINEVNIHIDILNFKGTTCFLGTGKVIAQILKHLQYRRANNYHNEATGLMSHHLVHDEATWNFLRQFFTLTRSFDNIVWQDANSLFNRA